MDPWNCVVKSSLMLQLQLAKSHSSWGQTLFLNYSDIKTQWYWHIPMTHLTSLTSLMCGMCRIITWPSVRSLEKSPGRGCMRHKTTVPATTVKRITRSVWARVHALECRQKLRTIFTTRCKTIPEENDCVIEEIWIEIMQSNHAGQQNYDKTVTKSRRPT